MHATFLSKPDSLDETTAKGQNHTHKEGSNVFLSNWKGLREDSTVVYILPNIIHRFHWGPDEGIMNICFQQSCKEMTRE